MVKLTRRDVILVELETNYGEDATPTADDAVRVEGLQWSNEGARMLERGVVHLTGGTLKHIFGGSLFGLTFQVEIKGSGAAGTAPRIGRLLQACGMAETVNAGVSVVYSPLSSLTTQKSVTIYLYEDGDLYIVTGCRGNVSVTLEAGSKMMATFTMVGHCDGPTATAMITPTYESTLPVPFLSAGIELGSMDPPPVIQSLTFDLGNQVITSPDANASDGFGEIRIVRRDVTGSINPEAVTQAVKDFIAEWRSGTTQALLSGDIGPAGNATAYSFPTIAFRELSPGDREGLRTTEIGFAAAETGSGDNELSITFS